MTITDNIFYICSGQTQEQKFGESNVLNGLIPDEIAIKTSPFDFL